MNCGENIQPSLSNLVCLGITWGFCENADSDIGGLRPKIPHC